MINVVIPIIDNAQEYSKSIASIANKEDVSILVGVVESLENNLDLPKTAVVKVFRDGSQKEEIINAMKTYLTEGKVVICRRAFTKKEFDSLIASDAQVVYFEKKHKNKVAALFKKWIGALIKAMFGVKFFDGDISLIAFDESMGEVLANVSSLSYSTRVDRWRGVEQATVIAERPSVKMENNKKGNIKMIVSAILSVIVPVTITILVALLGKVTFLIGMLLFCIDFVGLAGMFLILCMLFFNLQAGQRNFADAEEIGNN